MTDMVEVEDEPTLMREPNILNLIQPPAHFSYSYPGLLLNLERQAFLDDEDQTTSTEHMSVASTPETFYSVCGYLLIDYALFLSHRLSVDCAYNAKTFDTHTN
jgi:hypothetical protein